jgi:hypothetical protein
VNSLKEEVTAMPGPPYVALRIVLGIFAFFAAVVGVLMMVANRPLVITLFLHPPESEISTLLLATMKELGGLVLTLSIMLYFASRNPARNVAIIDALTVGLCILAITPLLSLYTLEIQRLYPSYMIWVRSLVRLALAGLFLYLRPRPALAWHD